MKSRVPALIRRKERVDSLQPPPTSSQEPVSLTDPPDLHRNRGAWEEGSGMTRFTTFQAYISQPQNWWGKIAKVSQHELGPAKHTGDESVWCHTWLCLPTRSRICPDGT